MATNTYVIATSFPNGLLLDLLIQEMPNVWPADLFPAQYSTNGPPFGTLTSGQLIIETPRDLTAQEEDDADVHFQLHDPTDGLPQGLTIDTLGSPSPAGQTQYVSDLDRATGPGTGTMAYSDGTSWLRIADDGFVI